MAPQSGTYIERRGEIEAYFDRTAAEAWSRLTSDAPLGRIRRTVRAGRDTMRETLLGWLPADLHGARVLDAGCGTGVASIAMARRGALVTAVDLSPTLLDLARERAPHDLGGGAVTFRPGDMLDAALGGFEHVIAMDSLIHYRAADAVAALERLAPRVSRSIVFTFAPRTPMLAAMHAVGRLFPRGDRAPSIEPVSASNLAARIGGSAGLAGWRIGRTRRIANGFYISHALELVRR